MPLLYAHILLWGAFLLFGVLAGFGMATALIFAGKMRF